MNLAKRVRECYNSIIRRSRGEAKSLRASDNEECYDILAHGRASDGAANLALLNELVKKDAYIAELEKFCLVLTKERVAKTDAALLEIRAKFGLFPDAA